MNTSEHPNNTIIPKVLILTHGRFGEEIIKSAEMIVETLENVFAIPLLPEDDPDTYEEKVLALLDENEESLVILTDIFRGTPSNVAISLLKRYDAYILTGLNLSMLLEACVSMPCMSQKELTEHLYEITQSCCRVISRETFGIS